MRRKETPIKYCEYCGKQLERKRWSNGELEAFIHFNRRKFCDQVCMANSFKGREYSTNPSWYTAHKRARETEWKTPEEVMNWWLKLPENDTSVVGTLPKMEGSIHDTKRSNHNHK